MKNGRVSCLAWHTLLMTAALFVFIDARGVLAAARAPIDSTIASPDHFDYAVPDAPAFQLLQVDSKAILRPGTRRELALMVDRADFKNFAIECAPFLLAHDGTVSLHDYRHRRALYNLRVSVGANTADQAGTNAAIGLRWSLLDSSDPYMNEGLIRACTEFTDKVQEIRDRAYRQLADTNSVYFKSFRRLVPDSIGAQFDAMVRDPEEGPRVAVLAVQKELPELGERAMNELTAPERQPLERALTAARNSFKDEWNRSILELGAAMSGNGADTLVSRARVIAYGGWVVGGRKLGPRGQLLLGGNARLERNATTSVLDSWLGGGGTRFYYGTNVAKVACEADIGWKKRGRPTYSGDLGAEIRIVPSLWVNPTVDLSRNAQGQPELSAHISVRYADLGVIPIPGNLTLKHDNER